jgi:hypothetical protein
MRTPPIDKVRSGMDSPGSASPAASVFLPSKPRNPPDRGYLA